MLGLFQKLDYQGKQLFPFSIDLNTVEREVFEKLYTPKKYLSSFSILNEKNKVKVIKNKTITSEVRFKLNFGQKVRIRIIIINEKLPTR